MTEPDTRPDPDALLARLRAEEEREKRAKLRIYLGYAPGVGKTFAMLSAARELRAQGVDAVVGIAETHGRYDTAALILGLEILPRRVVEYRGRKLEEFDLEAALARKPKVILVDELAHTNAEGLRHTKRWQDVLDLLDAGIDVHSTLNIQHIESLNDVVEQITQVRVRETVPDSILLRADEIELVDVPPEELLSRLRDGKVYLSEQAVRAVDNFFRRGNLLALRELALRRVADRVDQDVLAHRAEHAISATWATQERILVGIGPSPGSARLTRAAARMAAGLRAPWVAAYVERMTAPLSEADRVRLETNLRLAESLGAEVVRLTGAKPSSALLEYARKHNVTRLVIGKPTHWHVRDVLRGSLLDEVVRGSGAIDVHVISGDVEGGPASASGKPREKPPQQIDLAAYAWSAALVGVVTGLSAFGRAVLALPDIAMLYLLTIMIVATRLGRGPSVTASVLSVASYDFFFIPPYYTFAVTDIRHTLTFFMMFCVGLITSGLALRIRRGEQEARAREEQTAALYSLSRDLGTAIGAEAVAQAIATRAREVFEVPAAVIASDQPGSTKILAADGNVPYEAQEEAVARWVFEHARPAGLGTDTLPGARVSCHPLRAGPNVLGVLALGARPLGNLAGDRDLLQAYLRQGAMGLERVRLAEEAKTAALRARTEEMRSSLLSAVSHDLRTPLGAITGAGTMLRDDLSRLSAEQRVDLVDTICEEADRLERLVSSLLDMTRLESGSLKVRREWVPLEELVVSAATRLGSKIDRRPMIMDLPADLPLISVDPVLFEQVFVNLLENVAKYTPATSPVEIRALARDGGVRIEVADRGPGIPQGAEERIFEKFYRGRETRAAGVGLGLAICRGIVEAHGGTLVAENRPDGGALFRLALPIVGTPPALPAEGDVSLPEEEGLP